ncbi:hypothetical protein CON66_09145 [Bacillus cereus]|nr:hypothetical protein CON66_09145 [Bacillus cereus]PGN48628.1 hypothetical protein CN962_10650 [Bacillus cereus]
MKRISSSVTGILSTPNTVVYYIKIIRYFLWLVVKNSIELFLNGVNLSTDQSKVNTKSVIQYTHGESWG